MTWREKSLVVLLWLGLSPVAYGWSLYALWSWFVVPLGVVSVSPAWAYGIALTVRAVTFTLPPKSTCAQRVSLGEMVGRSFAGPFIFVALGAVAHALMAS
jgi:hypothetical protein